MRHVSVRRVFLTVALCLLAPFARAGEPHCPGCSRPISRQTVAQIVDRLTSAGEGKRLVIMAPVVRGRKGEHKALLAKLARDGFTRVRVDGEMRDLIDDT